MRRTEQRKVGAEQPRPQDTATTNSVAGVSEIQARLAAAPVLDARSPEEIIGYDQFGLPS